MLNIKEHTYLIIVCLKVPVNATPNQILKLCVNHSSVLFYILELEIELLNNLSRNLKSKCDTLQRSAFTQ